MLIGIIGANGQIGRLVQAHLLERQIPVRTITRSESLHSPSSLAESAIVPDYTPEQLTTALSGCSHVISVLGLKYDRKLWLESWPVLMGNIASSCLSLSVPLTVLDNMYVYGLPSGAGLITEATPLAPCSTKGKARLEGFTRMESYRTNGLDLVVCRAADFFGPDIDNTILPWQTINAVLSGKSKNLSWIGKSDAMHSFGFAPDLAKALAEVCIDDKLRFSKVLHLPVLQAITGKDFATQLSQIVHRQVGVRTLSSAMIRAAGLVSHKAREQSEMMYQVDHDYIVSDLDFRRVSNVHAAQTVAEALTSITSHGAL